MPPLFNPLQAVRQAGLEAVNVTGRYPAFGQVAATEGVVTAVRYIDDDRNRSKKYIEYDVCDLRSGQTYTNCRHVKTNAGQDDGDENTLRPAQKLQDNQSGGSFVFDPKTAPLTQSDGDRVLLSFVHGAHHSPVIVGVLQHSRTAYGGRRVAGPRRFTTFKGTAVETNSEGKYTITRGSTVFTIFPSGTLNITNGECDITLEGATMTLQQRAGATLTLHEDGHITVVAAPGLQVCLNGDTELLGNVDGVLTGQSTDPSTGLLQAAFNNGSDTVLAKKVL